MESVASDQGEALTHEGRRAAKSRLFDEFARVAKGLASPKRCELIDLIAQGEHTVENLARKASLSIASASQHLQVLSDAGLVRRRREGTFVHYRLADDDVATLFDQVRAVAVIQRASARQAVAEYLGGDMGSLDEIDATSLLDDLAAGRVVIVDVRPRDEFVAGHIDGAIGIPIDELDDRVDELDPDLDVVAYCRGRYCVYATDAVRLLRSRGRRARRLDVGMLEWRLANLPTARAI